jgi:hypothetical protein
MGPKWWVLDGGKLSWYHRGLRASERLIRELAPKADIRFSLFEEKIGFRNGAFTYGGSGLGRISRTVCEGFGFVVRATAWES